MKELNNSTKKLQKTTERQHEELQNQQKIIEDFSELFRLKLEVKHQDDDDTDKKLSKAQKSIKHLNEEKDQISQKLDRKEEELNKMKTKMEAIREIVLPGKVNATLEEIEEAVRQ